MNSDKLYKDEGFAVPERQARHAQLVDGADHVERVRDRLGELLDSITGSPTKAPPNTSDTVSISTGSLANVLDTLPSRLHELANTMEELIEAIKEKLF